MPRLEKTKRPYSLKTITAYDVARLAKVTQATVSRTINKPQTVAPATRQRVYDAMNALNYRPSASAQGLARGKSGAIGFLTSLDMSHARRFGFLVDGIVSNLPEEKHLLNIGYVPHTADLTEEDILRSQLMSKQYCDGIIIHLPHFKGDMSKIYRHVSCPYVNINPAVPQPTNCILPDDRATSQKAVDYLISRGHRRIAYFYGSTMRLSHIFTQIRYEGYIVSMSRAGLQPVERSDEPIISLETGTYDVKKAHRYSLIEERLESWLNSDDPVTAIVTQDSGLANNVAEIAYRREWRIPERFSLVSCDDIHIGYNAAMPITAVDLNLLYIGAEAARMMLKRLSDPGTPTPSVTVPCRLRVRKSVADISNEQSVDKP
jgi:LacI family transcriptional regulator